MKNLHLLAESIDDLYIDNFAICMNSVLALEVYEVHVQHLSSTSTYNESFIVYSKDFCSSKTFWNNQLVMLHHDPPPDYLFSKLIASYFN